MGRISKKLGTRFASWASQYRQQMGKLKKSFPVPKDVHDVQSLVAQGYDPLHAVYVAVQNITSVFAECVSVLPELKSYYKTVGDAEEEYMPDGPPMSPLTRSYFTTWAFFDFRFGGDHETIGTCLIDLGGQLGCTLAWSKPSASFKSPAWASMSIAARSAARSALRNWSLAGSCPASARQGTEGSPANSGMFGSARRWRTWWTTMWP